MLPDNTMTLIRGTRLGPYEIETPLGAGGMGEVYRARDTRLDRAVAIKVMRSRGTPSPAVRERFQREARAIAQLSQPSICRLYDVGHLEGTDFLVMEYLEGETLDTRISRQKLRSLRGDVPGPMAARAALPLDETTQYRVWTSDANGLGAAEVPDAVTANPTIVWLPDGRLAWQAADGVNYRIRDLANGHEELLMRANLGGYASYPHFSPNNEQVAIFWITRKSGLYVLSWPSREPRLLAPNLAPIGWSQDGEWIYALQAVQPFKAQNSTSVLMRVSPRTSRVELIGSFPRGYLTRGSCSLTPDRQAIICALAEEDSDAWIIDDFDPDMRSGKQ